MLLEDKIGAASHLAKEAALVWDVACQYIGLNDPRWSWSQLLVVQWVMGWDQHAFKYWYIISRRGGHLQIVSVYQRSCFYQLVFITMLPPQNAVNLMHLKHL